MKVEEKKKKKYEKAKKRYVEALATFEELKKKAEAHAGAVQEEPSSQVETRSTMQLFASIPIAHFVLYSLLIASCPKITN